MHTRRQLRVLRGLAPDLPHVLIKQILKCGGAALEAGGVDVGEVVGHDDILVCCASKPVLAIHYAGSTAILLYSIAALDQPRRMIWVVAASFSSAVLINFTCISR